MGFRGAQMGSNAADFDGITKVALNGAQADAN